MIKLTDDNYIYYFLDYHRLNEATRTVMLTNHDYVTGSLQACADVVLCRNDLRIIKCRYAIEDVFDQYFLSQEPQD